MYRLNILIMLLRIYFCNFEFLPQEFQNQRKRTRQCMRHVDLNPIGDQGMRSSELLSNYFRLHLKKICRLLCTISWTIRKTEQYSNHTNSFYVSLCHYWKKERAKHGTNQTTFLACRLKNTSHTHFLVKIFWETERNIESDIHIENIGVADEREMILMLEFRWRKVAHTNICSREVGSSRFDKLTLMKKVYQRVCKESMEPLLSLYWCHCAFDFRSITFANRWLSGVLHLL